MRLSFSSAVCSLILFFLALSTALLHYTTPSSTTTRRTRRRRIHFLELQNSPASPFIEYDDFLPNPNPSVEPLDVVRICMDTLMSKDNNEGLEVCFNFSADYLRAPFQGSLEKLIQHANNPIFGSLVKCTHYEIVSIGPFIEGTPTRGAMQTFLMDVESPGSEDRRYLWTLQKERRPPRSDCWLVRECLAVRYAFQLTE